jgi:hypothetical protein
MVVPASKCRPVKLVAKLGVLTLLAGLLSVGCARQPMGSQSADRRESETGDEQKLPFDQPPEKGGISPSSSLVPAARNVPAGTPLTIRLRSSISSETAHSGESFQAILDEPVVVQGRSIVPAGTFVSGEVVALNRSASSRAPAYLRLKLTSVALGGRNIPIESSSIFAKAGLLHTRVGRGGVQSPSKASDSASTTGRKKVQFSSERRLTFRLTEPVSLSR